MKNRFKNITTILTVLFASLMWSCTEDVTGDSDPTRLFRPVNIILSASENTVNASWAAMEGAVSYYAELYSSQTIGVDDDGDNILDYTLVARNEQIVDTEWSVPDLKFATTYYFRVRANSDDVNLNSYFSSDFYSVKTASEIQVLTYEILDIPNGIVSFSWMSGYDLSYIAITDSLGNIDTYDIVDADGGCTIEGIAAGSYTVVAGSSTREYNTLSLTIPVLYDIDPADNTLDGVTFRWTGNSNLDYILCVDPMGSEVYVDITSSSSGSQFVEASTFAPNTTYAATIYYEDGTAANTVNFTTMDSKPDGMIIVSTVDELADAIESAVSGAVIGVEPGEYHVTSTDADTGVVSYAGITITADVTIMTTSAELPKIVFKQFSLSNTAELGLVRIQGLEIEGYDEFDDSTTASYLFDLTSSATANVNQIEIEDCYIHGISNSLVRADRTATYTVKNILINNNMLYNMNGKQAYISTYNSDTATAIPESIIFTNNTVTGLGRKNSNQRAFGFFASESHVFTMTNNTFYDCQNGTSAFAQARGTADGSYGAVTVTNNIFYSSPEDAEKAPNNDLDFAEANAKISNNSLYFPWGSYSSTSGETTYYDWSEYSTITVDPSFVDAENFDFTPMSDDVISAKCGDPRWL